MTVALDRAAVEVLVRLKIPDVIAATALFTLRDRMKYAQLESLGREDYYHLELNMPDEDATELVDRMVAGTSLFANPNKHTWRLRRPIECDGQSDESLAGPLYSVGILVELEDDVVARMLVDGLDRVADYQDRVTSLRRGTLWRLDLRTSDADEAVSLAEEMARLRGREGGLLANPHYQRYHVEFPYRQ